MDFQFFALLGAGLIVALEVAAVIFAFRAIGYSRTPQGAVAWVVFLILAPFIAVAAYLFLGQSRIHGYTIARQKSQAVIDGVALAVEEYRPRGDGGALNYRAFEQIAELPVLSGNAMELLVDGEESFDAIFAAIDGAESYVLVQFYILRDDALGQDLAKRLLAARKRDVSVRVLYDSIGCSRLPATYVDELKSAGIEVYDSNALRGPTKRFQINFRNHRKTVVVDGKTGFTGGHNVGVEYLGQDPKFGHWRDTHVMLHGPVVLQLQLVFVEDWHWATNADILGELSWQVTPAPQNMDAVLLASGPADRLDAGTYYFLAAIAAAKSRIWIASPYFVPPEEVRAALCLAALRGVEVRILVPDEMDHYTPWHAAFAYFDELRACGAEIWRYQGGFLHQKVLLVDDSIASVGTINLDNRSCRLNFEATALFFDTDAARDVADMLETDFLNAYRLEKTITQQPWRIRYMAPIARLFSPLL
ncbi:cardiolipin synthase [Shimia biformata]|uniref:cardiolipin synthase n=1 Tax=Shimia biformata TaxID=1294299 RepID=UPI00194F6CC5|nr:cardiolipin synthase [Shimia biformata]